MGSIERITTTFFFVVATALVVYNGQDVSMIISSIANGANAVTSTLLAPSKARR